MSCKTVKTKRPEVCQQVRSLGFLHVQVNGNGIHHCTELHIALQILGGERDVTFNLQL